MRGREQLILDHLPLLKFIAGRLTFDETWSRRS